MFNEITLKTEHLGEPTYFFGGHKYHSIYMDPASSGTARE